VLAVARIRPGGMARRATWSTLLLLAVLFVLFDAVTRAGFVSWALGGLNASQRYGSLAANAIAAGGAALLSNAFNNLPIAVASSYVVAHAVKEQIAYPLIAGVDLGPNLMTSGSLATILWLGILRRHGVRVGLREYLRLGAVVVPATIAVCLLWFGLIG
jgi:arsenical pump membrane protein